MPPQLRHAVIAVEDKGFYDHPGIDVDRDLPRRVDRPRLRRDRAGRLDAHPAAREERVRRPVRRGSETGVRDYAVPPRTLGQKVRESLLAIKVEREFTKDQILAKYLNTVYFGRGAYGVQAAAQTYFRGRRRRALGARSPRRSPAHHVAEPLVSTRSTTGGGGGRGATTSLEQMAPRATSPPKRAAQLEGRRSR